MTQASTAVGQISVFASPDQAATSDLPVLRVVIPCSKWKVKSQAVASQVDLDERRAETHERLSAFAVPARDLYVGRAYQRSIAAVDQLRGQRPDLHVALHIASAGYGIVEARQLVVPYQAVMGSSLRQWIERGQFLGMPQQALSLVESCEVTIFALSQPYSAGCALASMEPSQGFGVLIGVGPTPTSHRLRSVKASRPQARGFAATEREVGSMVLGRLLDQIGAHGLDSARNLPTNPLDWPPS